MNLASTKLYRTLLVLNGLVTLAVFIAFRHATGGDADTYTTLADGLLHGRYSLWWWLPVDIPDTFRNPGYPLFLSAFRSVTTSVLPVQLVQLGMYALSIALSLRTITALGGGMVARNCFLMLLLPSINIAYYITAVFPEVITMFLISAFVYTEVSAPPTTRRVMMLALLAGLAFQMRSPILFFPLLWVAARWALERKSFPRRHAFVMLAVFGATLLPYALWNKHHHGVLRPTPLEGGGGVLHMGWWSGKIPGHKEQWYWGNVTNDELLRLTPVAAVPQHVKAYDAEWTHILADLQPLLTATDSLMLDSFATHRTLFRTYNTAYTLAREKALTEATIAHALEEPGYTVALKAYTAVRLWVTGINMARLRAASPMGKLAELYPFVLTLGILVLAVALVPAAIAKDRRLLRRWSPLLLWLIYFGAIHLPFAIQARYTIPVRLLLLVLIALAMEVRRAPVRNLDGVANKDRVLPSGH